MKSTGHSEYRIKCREYIETVLKRPSMYFVSILELELLLSGHAAAFHQMGYLEDFDSFHRAFGKYLEEKIKPVPSLCVGWGRAIAQIAIRQDKRDADVFAELVTPFLTEWAIARK